MTSCLHCNKHPGGGAGWTSCKYPLCEAATCGCDGTGLLAEMREAHKVVAKDTSEPAPYFCPAHVVSTLRRYTVDSVVYQPYVMVTDAAVALKISPNELLSKTKGGLTLTSVSDKRRLKPQFGTCTIQVLMHALSSVLTVALHTPKTP